jgi:hypothetical protein
MQTLTNEQVEQRDAFVERLLHSTAGLFDIFTVYIGDQLGFYRALANGEAITSVELAKRTGAQERYVREWLEQQTVTGVLEVENPDAEATARRFRLPAPHAEVLAERNSLNYLAPLSQLAVGAAQPIHAVLEAFRNGGGVPYADYGADLREGQGNMNRAMFLQELGQVWLPGVPDVHARLQADPPARVADIGCGVGWSSIGLAQAYPNVPTSAAGWAGPASAWPRPIPTFTWTAMTSTSPPLKGPGPICERPTSTAGCSSTSGMPATRTWPAATIW